MPTERKEAADVISGIGADKLPERK